MPAGRKTCGYGARGRGCTQVGKPAATGRGAEVLAGRKPAATGRGGGGVDAGRETGGGGRGAEGCPEVGKRAARRGVRR